MGFTEKNWIDEANHAGPPAAPPGTPLSAASLEDVETRLSDYSDIQGGPVYNVKDPTYGAIGNGVNDDTAEIQAAIDACPAGGKVLLPPGIYKITSTLTISKTLTFEGVGAARTANDNSDPANVGAQINYEAATGNAILVQPPNAVNSRIYPQLRNILVVGNRNFGGASAGGGISIDGRNLGATAVNDFVLDHCHVSEAYDDGLLMGDNVYEGRIVGCMFDDNGRDGIRGRLSAATVGPGEIRLYDVHTHDNVGNGIDIADNGTWQLFGCSSSRNVKALAANAIQLGVFGFQAESNSGDAVELTSCVHVAGSHWVIVHRGDTASHGVSIEGTSANVAINPIYFGDTTTGNDINVADTSSYCSFGAYSTPNGYALGSGAYNVITSGGNMRAGSWKISAGDMYVETNGGTYKLFLGDTTSLWQQGANTIQTYDKFLASAGIGVGNANLAATTLGTVTASVEIFDDNGASIGYLPVYNSIT